jgi:hypothetical protein
MPMYLNSRLLCGPTYRGGPIDFTMKSRECSMLCAGIVIVPGAKNGPRIRQRAPTYSLIGGFPGAARSRSAMR